MQDESPPALLAAVIAGDWSLAVLRTFSRLSRACCVLVSGRGCWSLIILVSSYCCPWLVFT